MIKFLSVDEAYKEPCSDGTKCCFLFAEYHKVDQFISELKERLNTDVTKDSFIGYKTIYVPIEKYEEAVIEGLNIMLNDKSYETAGACWVDCYNDRSCWKDAQILQMSVSRNCLNYDGYWTKETNRKIKRWKRKLQRILKTEVFLIEYCGNAKFFIKRVAPSEHENILNKIRQSNVIDESPFNGYALINYFGEHIK